MYKPTVTLIPFLLEAADFKGLRLLILKNNTKDGVYYPYEISRPAFKGDTWIAIYYKDIDSMVITKKVFDDEV